MDHHHNCLPKSQQLHCSNPKSQPPRIHLVLQECWGGTFQDDARNSLHALAIARWGVEWATCMRLSKSSLHAWVWGCWYLRVAYILHIIHIRLMHESDACHVPVTCCSGCYVLSTHPLHSKLHPLEVHNADGAIASLSDAPVHSRFWLLTQTGCQFPARR